MGCDEYHAGAVTGPLTVFISPSYINVTVGYPVSFTAFIEGRTDLSIWDFGDGALEINEPYTAHSWTAPGDYLVSLWAFSDSYPGGTNATVTIHVGTGLHYVAANSATSSPPFLSWATAATNIQDAINAATEVGTVVVLVTNGTYARITAYSPLTVRSVNGAQFTTIDGGRSNRCASLSSDASLSGFTLTNGASGYGAGASGGTLSNCVLSGNSAYNGGGAGGCTLINCSLTGNTANTNTASVNYGFGGGASDCTLQNCTLAGNAALEGGGAYHGTLTNCMLGGNLAYDGGGGANYCALNNCTLTQNSALRGGGAIGGTLNNCTLTGNSVTSEGGGAMVSTLNNCTLNGNSATNGGGAVGGTLNNCTLTGNSATNSGGGAYGCTLNNCTLIGNSASNSGGGVYYCTLNNCITYFNTAPVRANYTDNFLMNYCCTTPLPPFGGGNISNVPLFVDTNGWADLRLQSNSPCINAGNNSYLTNSYFTNYFDLDGSPRIKGGNVDMGAYEYQSPVSRISYAWLQQYGLPINASTDTADPDGDGLNNWQEWVSGTDPTNALSALRMMAPVRAATAPSGVTLTWQSVAGVNYFLERSTNLAAPVFVPLATNLFGQPGTTSYTDYSAIGPGPWFYRVGVSGQ
jgi:hypothetical protein